MSLPSRLFASIATLLLFSCKKDRQPEPENVPITKPILLKDITLPGLPCPFYHFEYNRDSLAITADFASGFTNYTILYSGRRIQEMRNTAFSVNDTLRYNYDGTGKLTNIGFINRFNIRYRQVIFTYSGSQPEAIRWEQKSVSGDYITDRTLQFTFYADGNLKTITEHRPSIGGSTDYTSVRTFEGYDDKINVDDFTLTHDGFHDHLFLLQGFRLQKNNARKELLIANGDSLYTLDYTYTYNLDKTPIAKEGTLEYLSGPNKGQRFPTSTYYTYY
ncbi:MAG TPA: hypothetical protein VHK91_08690 [Flavisolibacter sp.]|jgi:hypothetical protein|nr:hypothetical protein [Flavisolibacter sp.]